MKKEKGEIGCITCGTSIGCFFPLSLVLGVILIVAASSYFDTSYHWDETDTGMVIGLTLIVIPAIVVGIVQAALGAWSLSGAFDQDISDDELNLLEPIPSVDGNTNSDEEQGE